VINETQSETYLLRLTPAEKNKIKSNATLCNMSMNKYILSCINRKRIIICTELPELIYNINCIGNNINQIARYANTNHEISKNQFYEINRQIHKCHHEIHKFVKFMVEPEKKMSNQQDSETNEMLSEILNSLKSLDARMMKIEKRR
jgi:hypothetical protein